MPRPFVPYRRDLKHRSQGLRRDPSPAERKLWYEFLRVLPVKFTRQKPLGSYIADFYCSARKLVIEIDGDSHYTARAQRYDGHRTAQLAGQGIACGFSKNPKPPARLRLTTPLSGGQDI